MTFNFRLGVKNDAVPERWNGQLHDIIRYGIVATVEGRQRAGSLHQSNTGSG